MKLMPRSMSPNFLSVRVVGGVATDIALRSETPTNKRVSDGASHQSLDRTGKTFRSLANYSLAMGGKLARKLRVQRPRALAVVARYWRRRRLRHRATKKSAAAAAATLCCRCRLMVGTLSAVARRIAPIFPQSLLFARR